MSAPSSGARFPRSRRLLSRADYQRILRQPGRGADAYFAVAAQPQAEGDARRADARLGLAISRKALSRAVDRNRVKRIVREAFRHTAWPCPVDVVVIARAGLLRGTNGQVRRSIDAHFLKVCRRLCGTDPLR